MGKSKFSIAVCLVPFIHTTDDDGDGENIQVDMKVGLVETDLGYSSMFRDLEKGETSDHIVNDILIDNNFQVDREQGDFYLLLCDCLDSPNRYVGHATQNVVLVFRLDISKKETDCSQDLKWFGPEDLAELAANKKLVGDTHNTIEVALRYGQGRNEPTPELPTRPR